MNPSTVPLLVDFTEEDRAAKGLRTFTEETGGRAPVHFTAMEMVRDYPVLVLAGASGSGKSVFAAELSARVSAGVSVSRSVARNDLGDRRDEVWDCSGWRVIDDIDAPLHGISLLIVDDIDR
ncbi:MAG: hypothetical protein QM673_15060, partial [Gordonia sp. (in: high G+C Gram-positive bacteria)]